MTEQSCALLSPGFPGQTFSSRGKPRSLCALVPQSRRKESLPSSRVKPARRPRIDPCTSRNSRPRVPPKASARSSLSPPTSLASLSYHKCGTIVGIMLFPFRSNALFFLLYFPCGNLSSNKIKKRAHVINMLEKCYPR